MELEIRALPSTLVTAATGVRRVDPHGGEALRCCLRDSTPGEELVLTLIAPPGPKGPYAETGPVFVHAGACTGPTNGHYPDDFRRRSQVFRAYSPDGRIVGGRVVKPHDDQEVVARELLATDGVAFLHSRNVVYGCYMFAIHPVA